METLQTTQSAFTDDEKRLAEKYKVEPKTVRMIAEIVGEHTSEIAELDNLIKGKKEQEAEPEQAETQDQPEQEQPAELSIDEQTQERLKSYFKNLDPKTKMAIVTLSELQALEGINFQARQKEGKLMDDVWSDLEKTCIETFHKKPDDIADTEDIWFVGVWETVRMVLHNT